MKNKLTDLNDALFAQLERLGNEELTGEAIAQEVQRTAAVVQVADRIVENARLQLAACKLVADHGDRFLKQLPMIAPPAGDSRAEPKGLPA